MILPAAVAAAPYLLYLAIGLLIREATAYLGDTDARCRVRTALGWPVVVLVAAIGTVIALMVKYTIASATLDSLLNDAKENHAAIEGTWTPHQLRYERYERERTQWVGNHASFEGVSVVGTIC